MRFLVLSSLLCVLLLCFCIFSTEGGRHPGHPARPWKGKRCCSQAPDPVLKTRKGHRVKICRPCKFKPESPFLMVPGALPQV